MRPYKRRVLLINRRFQIRLAFYVCSWLLAICFVYPLIVHRLFVFFIQYAAMDPRGPDLAVINNTRADVLTWLMLSQVVFLGLTFIVSLFLAHRIAGPLYKLGQFFGKTAESGDLTPKLFFRKHDHFQELADQYNQMMGSLRQQIRAARSGIEAASRSLGQKERQEIAVALQSLPKIDSDRES